MADGSIGSTVRITRTTPAYDLGYKHAEKDGLCNCWSYDWPAGYTPEQITDYKIGYGDARDDWFYNSGVSNGKVQPPTS